MSYYKEHFDEKGYVVLEGVLNSEAIDRLTRAVDKLWEQHRHTTSEVSKLELDGKIIGECDAFFTLAANEQVLKIVV